MNTIEEIKDVFRRIKNRDFSGNKGTAIKNNIFHTSTIIIKRIGSLILTVLLARLLLPELFGLYSLALSTILLFTAFSNPGICSALVRFISKEIGRKNKKKAKAYATYIGKIKFFLVIFSVVALLILAKFISETYYQKPLFLALLAGALYIIFFRIIAFFQSILQASNYFKGVLYSEGLFQFLRVVLVSLSVILFLRYGFSSEVSLFLIIFSISFAYFITAIFMNFLTKKKISFYSEKSKPLNKKESKKTNKFILSLSATVLSEMFFSYIGILILGAFVLSEFIGYYKVAISLIGPMTPIISFSMALLPILSRLGRKRIEGAFNKSAKITFLISLPLFLIVFFFADFIIMILYGNSYLPAANMLRVFSLLLISFPLIALYKTYFISMGKPKIIAKFLIISTVINIVLSLLVVIYLLSYGPLYVVYGIIFSNLISRYFLLGGLFISKIKLNKEKRKNLIK